MLGDSSSALPTAEKTSGGGGGGGGSTEAPSVAGGHEAAGSEVGHEGGGGSNSGEEDRGKGDEGDRIFGGNRWPRQETLALLKIRSDMDLSFREAGVKGPLWEEVSRKLGELGYHRSAKKCREKFENVYKYHKRTKEGRTGKQQGKTYRFFEQLEAFENQSSSLSSPLPPPPKPQIPAIATPAANLPPILSASNITTTATLATTMPQGIVTPTINLTVPAFPSANPTILPTTQATNPINPPQSNFPSSFLSISTDFLSSSTSSSTSSDVELQRRHKRKRKWKDFFERLMKEVMQKQEEMQRRFLESIEKREHERMVREESWRVQEIARINREREILAQERSLAAAKDAAVMAFLQKLSEQNAGQGQLNLPASQPPPPPAPSPLQSVPPPPQPMPPLPQPALATSTPSPLPVPVPQAPQPVTTTNLDAPKSDNGDQNLTPRSSSRWPKVEVHALIRLRTSLDSKYKESGPKGPLWEEISSGMKRLGYNRNAKRCKEKWENINKYFKKVKESNKKRPEDSKTCPYFHQLEALYREKNRIDGPSTIQLDPENSVPLMVRPEQQWPPPPQQEQRPDSVMEDLESEDNQNPHDDNDDKDNDDEEEDEAGGYEIVASKPASMS